MTTQTALRARPARPDVPQFSVAGAFLEGLATQDFDRLAGAVAEDARLSALVPSGLKQWDGAEQIRATFRRWFGEVEAFELVEAVMGEVGPRLNLRWRARVRAERFGNGWTVVEQQVYADTGPDGRIARMSLLCSGFCPETDGSAPR
jgi:hypothetical protein